MRVAQVGEQMNTLHCASRPFQWRGENHRKLEKAGAELGKEPWQHKPTQVRPVAKTERSQSVYKKQPIRLRQQIKTKNMKWKAYLKPISPGCHSCQCVQVELLYSSCKIGLHWVWPWGSTFTYVYCHIMVFLPLCDDILLRLLFKAQHVAHLSAEGNLILSLQSSF